MQESFTVPNPPPEIILGVELIGDWIKKLQKTTGMFVKTITFRQDRCIDVVIPTAIVFHSPENPDCLVRINRCNTQPTEHNGKN